MLSIRFLRLLLGAARILERSEVILKLFPALKPDLLPPMLLAIALLFWGQAAWIYAKAQVAQVLIAHAWDRSLAAPEEHHKPWTWADTWPVLRLQWEGDNAKRENLYVLANADGSSLAFGPGLLSGPADSAAGLKVIAAHRDTHFAFLEQLQAGDKISVQDKAGEWRVYEVAEINIVDIRNSRLAVNPGIDALLLITCYPFNALNAGGPLRYLVQAFPA